MSAYRGRFAPTPSGPLHFGSLIAALGSFLDARHFGGKWLVRIEDIDPPRCPAGASDTILRQLEAFGLCWDEDIRYQQTRGDAYQEALDRLLQDGLVYPCSCSRKQWRNHPIYPGWCRAGVREPGMPVAWRWRSDLGIRPVEWSDRLFGCQTLDPAEFGDVILKRKDDLWAYQLAVVVDDADQGITDIVRGYDLLDNTPWQRQLQIALGASQPDYLHLPLIIGPDGQKLSKQNLAAPLPYQGDAVRDQLYRALIALDQSPPKALADATVHDQLEFAIHHWEVGKLPANTQRQEPGW
ncbi:tRNA glutamyl-Q(34) synthetase GluQRS [Aidingimonas halophila]|uniref:Glutamyl-Q tRNA(Asp) synthetase n=1 Tax=Aidingimonas halophila TaxID=574349 RepID=A0A1H2YEW4_9GAMM|nr:tRNA glutamyl-Q(34) synthetase GluQRS [Aidingimonas halophila]GHC34835.1 glutamyl-Q tRNA(Asp) synthetase [Aidingimonas halophila]SDX03089.1 glutamyl-Q tRNA(Asp) synthetase [Aidingimonas halophila]